MYAVRTIVLLCGREAPLKSVRAGPVSPGPSANAGRVAQGDAAGLNIGPASWQPVSILCAFTGFVNVLRAPNGSLGLANLETWRGLR